MAGYEITDRDRGLLKVDDVLLSETAKKRKKEVLRLMNSQEYSKSTDMDMQAPSPSKAMERPTRHAMGSTAEGDTFSGEQSKSLTDIFSKEDQKEADDDLLRKQEKNAGKLITDNADLYTRDEPKDVDPRWDEQDKEKSLQDRIGYQGDGKIDSVSRGKKYDPQDKLDNIADKIQTSRESEDKELKQLDEFFPSEEEEPSLADAISRDRSEPAPSSPPVQSEKKADSNIAKAVNDAPRDLRAEIWKDYKDQKERLGWAQAAETIGHALTKYFAARQGVTGIETKATDWGSYLDRAMVEYKQKEDEITLRERDQIASDKEAQRQTERKEDQDIRKGELEDRRQEQKNTATALADYRKESNRLREKQMELTKLVAEGKLSASEVNRKKKELKKEQDKLDKAAKEERRTYLAGLAKRMKELSKIDGDEIDTPSELLGEGVPPALVKKMEEDGIVSESRFVNSDEDKIKQTLLLESTNPGQYVPQVRSSQGTAPIAVGNKPPLTPEQARAELARRKGK